MQTRVGVSDHFRPILIAHRNRPSLPTTTLRIDGARAQLRIHNPNQLDLHNDNVIHIIE